MAVITDRPTMGIERLVLGPYQTNAYIVTCRKTGKSLLVDAPAQAPEILKNLRQTMPAFILLTHSHEDHTGALEELRAALNVPLVCHAADSSALERTPEIMPSDGDLLRVGRLRVKVLHTPGHTPGSLCFKIGSYLFAGDTVFPGGPGHTASPEDFTLIVDSISRKILTLPARTVVLPGHGNGTTVGQARKEYAVFASRAHPHGLCGDVLWLS